MATDKQINANRKNAQISTGPRTEAGKANSSRNALTLGLFTQTDYVLPKERPEYDELGARCMRELRPEGVLEESFVIAILSARWRLRRCALVENHWVKNAELDPMLDGYKRDTQNSIDRARSRAFSILSRATAELRRLQTDRALTKKLLAHETDLPPLVSTKHFVVVQRLATPNKGQGLSPQNAGVHNNQWSLASNCTGDPQTPRNGRCPCGSGEKFKRCCGKDAPPVLSPGSAPVPKAA